jgi:hypothetical protein
MSRKGFVNRNGFFRVWVGEFAGVTRKAVECDASLRAAVRAKNGAPTRRGVSMGFIAP